MGTERIKIMLEATETPSEHCLKGKEHEFKFVAHEDGRETYTDFYRCDHCGEYVKKVQQRTGTNKELWE